MVGLTQLLCSSVDLPLQGAQGGEVDSKSQDDGPCQGSSWFRSRPCSTRTEWTNEAALLETEEFSPHCHPIDADICKNELTMFGLLLANDVSLIKSYVGVKDF